MDSLESIILVLIILCIIILFKIKSNRKIEGFGFLGSVWRAIKKAAAAVAEAIRKAAEILYIAVTLGVLMVELTWLIPKFFRDGSKKARTWIRIFHYKMQIHIQRVRKFGFGIYGRIKDTIDKYFNLAMNTIKRTAFVSVDKMLKMFTNIVKNISNLFHTEIINVLSKGMNEFLFQIKKAMKYVTNTIKYTLINVKKQAIILFHGILNDTNKNINKFTSEINRRFKLVLGSTYAKIQPYMIFISSALFLLIGGGIFSYFYFSSSEDINEVNEVNNINN